MENIKRMFQGLAGVALTQLMLFLVIAPCLSLNGSEVYAAENKGIIRLNGTGAALGSMQELAAAFQKRYPHAKVDIGKSLGSTGAIKAVLAGAADIAVSGRLLKDEEAKQGAVSLEYARTPLVFVANYNIEGMKFNLKQIASMYSGETTNWPDGTPVRLVLRPKSDSETIVLMGISPEMADAVGKAQSREGLLIANTDQDSMDMLQQLSGSFGTSSLSLLISEKRSIAVVPVDGVMPSTKTLADGAYPFFRRFYIVTGPKPSPLAKEFIKFITSTEGGAILAITGHIVEAKDDNRNQ